MNIITKYAHYVPTIFTTITVKTVFQMSRIMETFPYPFGNFRKLSFYNCFMPI